MAGMNQLEDDLLALPMKMRASLARVLINSLDQGIDPDADQLWQNEIRRRDAQIREGKAVLKPIDQVILEVQELLRSMK